MKTTRRGPVRPPPPTGRGSLQSPGVRTDQNRPHFGPTAAHPTHIRPDDSPT